MSIARNAIALRILAVAVCLIAFQSPVLAQEEGEHECIKDQYVISTTSLALGLKAAKELDDVDPASLVVNDVSAGAVLVTGFDPNDDDLVPESRRNACDRMREARREQLRGLRATNSVGIVRNFKCDCNGKLEALRTPNDSNYGQQWGFNQSSDIDMNLPEAWEMSTGSSNTVVAVIDTGVDYNHPDLQNNMWRNPGEIAGNGIDDDGNGYIDDVYGLNAISGAVPGNPLDDNGHGSHVAGTIGATGNNGIGAVGVNWNVKIMAVKFLSSTGSGSLYDAVVAIDYVTMMKNRGVNVILSNNSWGGGGFYQSLYDAIARARSAGLLFVAAAGNANSNNDATPSYPASYTLDNIISVAAIGPDGARGWAYNQSGNRVDYSNYGATSVDIAAPGSFIASTYFNGRYESLSGTSMATPHVSGALALLHGFTSGSMSWSEMRDALFRTGRAISSMQGITVTGKMVDARALLQDALDRGRVGPTPTPSSTPTPRPTATPTPIPTPTMTPTPTPLPPPGYFAISGIVTAGGRALAGVKLVLKMGSTEITKYSGPNGEYRFSNIYGPIAFTLTPSASGVQFSAISSMLVRDTTYDLVGTVKRYNLKGTVMAPNGAAVAGATINGGLLGNTVTDSQGKFTFSVDYGTNYSLTASAAGYSIFNNDLTGTIYGEADRTIVAVP